MNLDISTGRSLGDHIRRVGIVFAGGPAPGANAVISAAATCFLDDGREVIAFLGGYESLQDYHPVTHRLQLDRDFKQLTLDDVTGLRNQRGVRIGTSRANPGKQIKNPTDLDDPAKNQRLCNVYCALVDLGVDALISIGGDDTLKTANYLVEYQKRMPESAKTVQIIHLPKTIDNDYEGIDFTFGYFTAVDFLAKEVRNLRADAISTKSYFIVESMGRKAGWLSYGVGIAGEANLIISVEDITGPLATEEVVVDEETGEETLMKKLRPDKLVDRIVTMMISRETQEGKGFGVVVLAEGLVELFPEKVISDVEKDEHGHIGLGKVDLGKMTTDLVTQEYTRRTGRKKKVTGVQLGYESRCAEPHAFDVMLGSQLGIGAFRALVERNLHGHMVSVSGQLDLQFVPFAQLIDPETLHTKVRFIERSSDFWELARFLETRTEALEG